MVEPSTGQTMANPSGRHFAPAVAMRPLLVGETLDVAIRVVRRRFRLFALMCLPVVAVHVVSAVIQITQLPRDSIIFRDDLGGFRTTQGLTAVVAGIVWLLALGASVALAGSVYLGQVTSVGVALGRALRRLIPIIVITIVLLVALVPSALTGLGWLFVLTVFGVTVPACVLEGLGPIESIRRSWRLSIRRFWAVLATLSLTALPLMFFGYLAVIFGLISRAGGLFSRTGIIRATIISALLSSLTSALAVLFIGAVLTVMFYDLQVRQEGFDLAIALRSLPALGTGARHAEVAAVAASPFSPWQREVAPGVEHAPTAELSDPPTASAGGAGNLSPWMRPPAS